MPELLNTRVLAGVRSGNAEVLRAIAAEYPGTVGTTLQEDMVLVELRNDDLGALNAFVAARGVHVSHLALRRQSLEDAFMELTLDHEQPAGVA